MSTLSIAIIVVFIVGYLFIALESVTKVNKAAVALLMFVVVWSLYMLDQLFCSAGSSSVHGHSQA